MVKSNIPAKRNLLREAVIDDIYSRPKQIDRDLFPHREISHIRTPWIVSTKFWMRRGIFIPLFVNPAETSWQMPRRETMVKTKAGLVRNVWRNRFRRSYYDEFTINITFQSGNIMPGQPYPASEDRDSRLAVPSVPAGLRNFYMFMEMLDQEALLGTEENRHIIYYRSRIFPVMYMEGYFTPEPLAFTDSAANGNMVQWTHTFRVYRTSPRINSHLDMENVYHHWVRERASTEIVPPATIGIAAVAPPPADLVAETLGTLPRRPELPAATAGEPFRGPVGSSLELS